VNGPPGATWLEYTIIAVIFHKLNPCNLGLKIRLARHQAGGPGAGRKEGKE